MAITPLPDPPSRADPANFATRGDAFMVALPTFVTEANALQADVAAKQAQVAADMAAAAAALAAVMAAEANALAAAAAAAAADISEANAAASAAAAAASAASINPANFHAKADDVALAAGKAVIFEGTTADAFETTLIAADPTADRTAVLPDANITVAGINHEQAWEAQQTPFDGTLTDAATIDWSGDSNGQVVSVTTAAARTFGAPTNINENALYVLKLTTGGYTPAWNAAFKWPSGGMPTGLQSGTYVFTFMGGAANTLIPTGPGYLTGG
jgi:hypothetical protein